MKRVHNTEQLLHLFCNMVFSDMQDFRTPSRNLYVDNGVLYSYGPHYPMAKKYNCLQGAAYREVILVNSNGYSVTTAKHTSWLFSSMKPGQVSFSVPDVTEPTCETNLNTMSNYLTDAITACLGRSVYATVKEVIQASNNITLYNELFKTNIPNIPADFLADLTLISKDKEVKQQDIYNQKVEKLKKQRELNAQNAEDKLKSWLAGEDVYVSYYNLTDKYSHDLIRIKGERVQTWRGAEVSYILARRYYDKLKAGELTQNDSVGPFKIEAITDNEIIIGRHKFKISDLDAIFNTQQKAG